MVIPSPLDTTGDIECAARSGPCLRFNHSALGHSHENRGRGESSSGTPQSKGPPQVISTVLETAISPPPPPPPTPLAFRVCNFPTFQGLMEKSDTRSRLGTKVPEVSPVSPPVPAVLSRRFQYSEVELPERDSASAEESNNDVGGGGEANVAATVATMNPPRRARLGIFDLPCFDMTNDLSTFFFFLASVG
jgi:hypothetical protein